MRSLSLLALLLFTVVVSTPTPPSPQPLSATSTLVDEVVGSGYPRRFVAYNGYYLTDDGGKRGLTNTFHVIPKKEFMEQHWTIEKMNENEVAIRSYRGHYVAHWYGNEAALSGNPGDWHMLTPVKNADGSWSFKSRYGRWLSGGGYGKERVDFMPENKKCEQWKLELW